LFPLVLPNAPLSDLAIQRKQRCTSARLANTDRSFQGLPLASESYESLTPSASTSARLFIPPGA